MVRFLYIILIGQFLISCINMNDPESQARYIECRDKFDERILKLFPDRLPNTMLGFGFAAPYENMPGQLNLTEKYFLEQNYFEVKARYAKQSKYRIASTDTCLFIIDNDKEIGQTMCTVFYPIPATAIYENELEINGKTKRENSEVFIINLVSGDYLHDNEKHTRQHLPETWTHGYSTGVTTNDQYRTIQIWLVVW